MTGPKTLHPSELARLRTAIDAFPPRPIADFLLSVFIKHATDTFFYFDQDQVLNEIDQFYKDTGSSLRLDISFVCLAMATFALGSQWAPLERPDESAISLHHDNDDLGRIFYNHAKALIPDIIDRPCLRSIQAPFLLGVYLMPASAIGSSYIYMGLALRKALACDLHIEADDHSINEREREVRRRLWWSIYSLERSVNMSGERPDRILTNIRCTTVKLNRPRSVNIEIIKIPHPSPLLALDRLQKYDNVQFQMAYTRLMKILDQIAEPRYVTSFYVTERLLISFQDSRYMKLRNSYEQKVGNPISGSGRNHYHQTSNWIPCTQKTQDTELFFTYISITTMHGSQWEKWPL
jgi:hypothetical protein